MIFLTDAAVEKILEIRRSTNRPAAALRLAVLGGGCAGFKYYVGLDDFRAESDYCVCNQGIDIYIDYLSAPYLWKSEIDWIEEKDQAGFVVSNLHQNPNRKRCSNDSSCCSKEIINPRICNANKIENLYRIE